MPISLKHLDRICLTMVLIISLGCGYVVANASIRQKREINFEKEQCTNKSNAMKLAETNLRLLNLTLEETKKQVEDLWKELKKIQRELLQTT